MFRVVKLKEVGKLKVLSLRTRVKSWFNELWVTLARDLRKPCYWNTDNVIQHGSKWEQKPWWSHFAPLEMEHFMTAYTENAQETAFRQTEVVETSGKAGQRDRGESGCWVLSKERGFERYAVCEKTGVGCVDLLKFTEDFGWRATREAVAVD